MSVDQTPTPTQHVKDLIARAAKVNDSGDAMRLAQAAQNAANALILVREIERSTSD